MYSGLKIYLKRAAERTTIFNPHPKQHCDMIIGYGSETGSTLVFAQAIHQALLDVGRKSYLVALNEFEVLSNMRDLLVITATYGVGQPPSNASRFLEKLQNMSFSETFNFCVLGFGSTKYPDFCQFAIDANAAIAEKENATSLMPLTLINNRSLQEFQRWSAAFQNSMKLQLSIKAKQKAEAKTQLEVINKAFSRNEYDHTFLLTLSGNRKKLRSLQSGDLLIFRPDVDGIDRQYSMSVSEKKDEISLSIKRHEKGVVSNYLSSLHEEDQIDVTFYQNKAFHFPENAKKVIMIANGTGIAPFLGMIEGNVGRLPVILFWGGQNEASYGLYKSKLEKLQVDEKLEAVYTAFSRIEKDAKYVQDLIAEQYILIENALLDDASLMICGSLKMQEAVESILDSILQTSEKTSVASLKEECRILADCY
ncbi:MAG: NADPH cytochrome P450 oxidoreductase family protein [Bacteroidota bacterium]